MTLTLTEKSKLSKFLTFQLHPYDYIINTWKTHNTKLLEESIPNFLPLFRSSGSCCLLIFYVSLPIYVTHSRFSSFSLDSSFSRSLGLFVVLSCFAVSVLFFVRPGRKQNQCSLFPLILTKVKPFNSTFASNSLVFHRLFKLIHFSIYFIPI